MGVKKLIKSFILWLTGGIIYFFFEIMVRGYSHISMFVCGGFCFLVVGVVGNIILNTNMRFINKIALIMLMGASVITIFELLTGVYVNLYLGLDVWDYRAIKFNFMGQVCLLYSLLWSVLSLPCVYFSGVIKRFIFDVGE